MYHGTKGVCRRGTKALGSLHGWLTVWIKAEVERDTLENRQSETAAAREK